MDKTPDAEISTHIVEIRYQSNLNVLDHRGAWAQEMAELMGLTKWQIGPDRLDVSDADSRESCFVAVKNAGYVIQDPSTANEFAERASRFVKELLQRQGFAKPLPIARIGVRSQFCRRFDGEFTDLLERFQSRYLSLTREAHKVVGAKLVGMGAPVNFLDEHGHFNTNCSPMVEEQIAQLFTRKSTLPRVGLYYDIDYWKRDVQLDAKDILSLIRTFAKVGWSRRIQTMDLILRD